MNVREQLLNSEIQHLGQMIQILSYELTILNDFVREKFGNSYEAFRQKHSLSSDTNVATTSRSGNSLASGSGRSLTSQKSKRLVKNECSATEGLGSLEEFQNESEGDSQDMDMSYVNADPIVEGQGEDSTMFGDDDYTGEMSNVPEDLDLPTGSIIVDTSKKQKTVWKEFIVAKLPNRKIIAKCKACLNMVSPKVERLENHYEKCGLQRYGTGPKRSTSTTSNQSSVKHEMSEGEESLTSKPKRRDSSLMKGDRGRKHDKVWTYFEIYDFNEPGKGWKKKTVKCKKCGKEVSPKVERVRRHFVFCYGIGCVDVDDNDNADNSNSGGHSGAEEGHHLDTGEGQETGLLV